MRKRYLITAIILAIYLTITIPISVINASGSQIWYLDQETTDAGFQMEKIDPNQSGSIPINNGNSLTWIADQQSQGVAFPSGTWFVDIATDSEWGLLGNDCEVLIGKWDSTNGFQEFQSITQAYQGQWSEIIDGTDITHVLKVSVQVSSEVVENFAYLAVQIANNSGQQRTIYTDEGPKASCVKSPQTDPGYPVPEMATGALFGIGIASVGTLFIVRGKKAIAFEEIKNKKS